MGLSPPVCAFGVPGQGETHGSSGFETDLKNVGMFDSGSLAASVASDWPAAFIEPEVFVVAALNAFVWVIVGPLVFACVATLGAVLSAFWFAAMMCLQRFVTGALMELEWETDQQAAAAWAAAKEGLHVSEFLGAICSIGAFGHAREAD